MALLIGLSALACLWFLWATLTTSSTFALVGGSEALAKVARHPASYRWLFGGLVVCLLIVGQHWIIRSMPASDRIQKLRKIALAAFVGLLSLFAIGLLNWTTLYNPLANSVQSSFGGILVDEVELKISADGPCVDDVVLAGKRLTINDKQFQLCWFPLPLEDNTLADFLESIRCPPASTEQ